jgi:hypothetical protein
MPEYFYVMGTPVRKARTPVRGSGTPVREAGIPVRLCIYDSKMTFRDSPHSIHNTSAGQIQGLAGYVR